MRSLGLTVLAGTATAFASAVFAQPVPTPVERIEPGSIHELICRLEIQRYGSSVTIGSAVLYRERYLITTGQNVMQDWVGVKSIKVRCGEQSANSGTVDAIINPRQIRDARGYRDQLLDGDRNLGVIRLSRKIKTKAQVILAQSELDPLGSSGRPDMDGTVCYYGYPRREIASMAVLHEACTSNVQSNNAFKRVRLDIDSKESDSGGPLLRKLDENTYELVAINTGRVGKALLVDDGLQEEVAWLIYKLDRRAGVVWITPP